MDDYILTAAQFGERIFWSFVRQFKLMLVADAHTC